jgi:hypothetical protein
VDRGCFLDQRRGDRLGRWRRCVDDPCGIAGPYETSPLVVSHWMHVKEFILQVVEVVVIKVKASLEGAIGDASLAFEEVDDLGENVIEGHR